MCRSFLKERKIRSNFDDYTYESEGETRLECMFKDV
jgi:hypothetical protein